MALVIIVTNADSPFIVVIITSNLDLTRDSTERQGQDKYVATPGMYCQQCSLSYVKGHIQLCPN